MYDPRQRLVVAPLRHPKHPPLTVLVLALFLLAIRGRFRRE